MRQEDSQYEVRRIPTFHIWVDDDFNCRHGITKDSVEELSQSIEQEGLLFPIDVQPGDEVEGIPAGFRYRLVCGFRRFSACRMLGWDTIPARVRTGLTERQAALMNLTENLERKDLNTLEEAHTLDKLFPPYRTIQSIAKELKKPIKWVSVRRHLLTLPVWIQKAVASGRITDRDLQSIIHSPDPEHKARQYLRAHKEGGKSRLHYNGKMKRLRNKTEVKELITQLLEEGFHPQLLRFLAWTIGEINDDELQAALSWLRDRKAWLK